MCVLLAFFVLCGGASPFAFALCVSLLWLAFCFCVSACFFVCGASPFAFVCGGWHFALDFAFAFV